MVLDKQLEEIKLYTWTKLFVRTLPALPIAIASDPQMVISLMINYIFIPRSQLTSIKLNSNIPNMINTNI